MGFSKEIYKEIIEEKRIERQRAEQIFDMKSEAFYNDNPCAAELKRTIAQLAIDATVAAIKGHKGEIEKFSKMSEKMQEELNALIGKAGLVRVYSCPDCHDTGFIGGKYCACVHRAAKEKTRSRLSEFAPFDECTFDTFSLEYYDGKNREIMEKKTLKAVLDFCDAFPKGENLLFLGKTGLGKTHLSIAVADCIINKGYNVFYISAGHAVTKLENEKFGKNDQDSGFSETLTDCDLLVLDDLGTEFSSTFSRAAIYEIINERILQNKSTIISTNLSIGEIEERYSERLSSRFIGNYKALPFLGEDIRQKKAYNK